MSLYCRYKQIRLIVFAFSSVYFTHILALYSWPYSRSYSEKRLDVSHDEHNILYYILNERVLRANPTRHTEATQADYLVGTAALVTNCQHNHGLSDSLYTPCVTIHAAWSVFHLNGGR